MGTAVTRIPTYRAVSFPAPHTVCEHRPDRSILMRSARRPAEVSQSSYADWVPFGQNVEAVRSLSANAMPVAHGDPSPGHRCGPKFKPSRQRYWK